MNPYLECKGRGCIKRGFALLVLAMTLLLAACSSWELHGDTCVLERDDDTVQRVVNYSDPELCERPVQRRGPDYVRVPHPDD